MNLHQELAQYLDKCYDDTVRAAYEQKLKEEFLVRDENIHSHCCVYFVPFDPSTQHLLIGAHKKSGLWLMPGGHIDAGENLLTTLNREITEELGVHNFFTCLPEPFLLSLTHIVNDVRPCQEHFDIWFIMETDGADMVVGDTEYHEVRWVSIAEAKALTTDPANQQALKRLVLMYSTSPCPDKL